MARLLALVLVLALAVAPAMGADKAKSDELNGSDFTKKVRRTKTYCRSGWSSTAIESHPRLASGCGMTAAHLHRVHCFWLKCTRTFSIRMPPFVRSLRVG